MYDAARHGMLKNVHSMARHVTEFMKEDMTRHDTARHGATPDIKSVPLRTAAIRGGVAATSTTA